MIFRLILASLVGAIISLSLLSGGFHWNAMLEKQVNFNRTTSSCTSQYAEKGCSACIQDQNCAFCYKDSLGSCDMANPLDDMMFKINETTSNDCDARTVSDEAFWSDAFCPKTKASWMAVFGMILYLISFSPGLGPVPWAVCSEVFPQSYREAGVAMSTATNWISNCLVSLTFLR